MIFWHKYQRFLFFKFSELFGIDFNELQPVNISILSITFIIFQFEISGKDYNELHW